MVEDTENNELVEGDGEDIEIDQDVVIEEGESEDPQTDERGVPLKNVYAEVNRKMKAFQERIREDNRRALSEKDNIIGDLQARINELENQKSSGEEFTEDDLYLALKEAKKRGDVEVEVEVQRRINDMHERHRQEEATRQSRVAATKAGYDNEAIRLYGVYGIQDSTSEFYSEVAREMTDRARKGIAGPSAVLDAANIVAQRRPDLVGGNKRMSPAPRRGGFSESGSGRPVTKTTPSDVEIKGNLFRKWKQEFPGLSEKSILERMKDYKKRANWTLGDAI